MGDNGNKTLEESIGKRLNTTMIFPLNEFETAFGDIWGHGKPWGELTSQQKEARKLWKECRTNILNNGNLQKRQLFQLLEGMDCNITGYKSSFRYQEEG